MSDKGECFGCRFAQWKRTTDGRLHPDGTGRCTWKLPYVPKAAAYQWIGRPYSERPDEPSVSGGYLNRRDLTFDECEVYEPSTASAERVPMTSAGRLKRVSKVESEDGGKWNDQ